MKWIDKIREISDSLPNVSDDDLAFTTTMLVTPHEAKGYLEKNIYGLAYDVQKFLDLKQKITDGSLREADDVIASKGALVSGVALLLAIVDTDTSVVQVISTNVRWEDDPRNFNIWTTRWGQDERKQPETTT